MGLDQYIYKIKREEKFYYRKFNALHNYMVQKKNNGKEINCEPVSLNKEDFEELKRIAEECLDVIMPKDWKTNIRNLDFERSDELKAYNHEGDGVELKITEEFKEKVAQLLPPTGGFFFGSTEIDDYYVICLYDFYDDVCELLNDYEDGDEYAYDAWW